MTRSLIEGIDRLARRPSGPRKLLYLDQSVLSEFARGAQPRLLRRIQEAVAADRLVCPRSDISDQESQLAPLPLRRALDDLADELSGGVWFYEMRLITWYELDGAAAEFLGVAPLNAEAWQEAFTRDPQGSLVPRSASTFHISFAASPHPSAVEEVKHAKESVSVVRPAQDAARQAGHSFVTQAQIEQEAALNHTLGVLFEPQAHETRVQNAMAEAADEMEAGDVTRMLEPGSKARRWEYVYLLNEEAKSLLERYPDLRGRAQEFKEFLLQGPVPALRYPALLWAGLGVVTRDRRPRPGDRHDIDHLTLGLSRCHMVTADSGMTQLCRRHPSCPARLQALRST